MGEPSTPQHEQGDLFNASSPDTAPTFVRRARPVGTPSRWWWPAVAGLALIAALQWAWVEREAIARDAAWRPGVERVCAWLGCALPPWHEPGAFQVTMRDVRPHPSVDGALLITATFRNGAAFPQAWPMVTLSLSNLEGRPIGSRRFAAEEYLGGAPSQPLIEAGQSARITLEVVDADREAVAFAFEFR